MSGLPLEGAWPLVAGFVTNNVLPALVAGAVAWLIVATGVRLFDIRHGRLRLCLFLAAPIKSTLVLLGLATVLPWPREVFRGWADGAVDASIAVPLFMAVAGAGFLAYAWTASRERAIALAGATPAAERSPRLAAAYERIGRILERDRQRILVACGCEPPAALPELLVTRREIGSPLVVVDDAPTIVFPESLLDRFDDRQLEGALAHEVAHVEIRRHFSCTSSELIRRFTAANPFALAVASQLELEEEKACDDMAVAVTGDPVGYADMLLAGYRYASGRQVSPVLATASRLLGVQPTLSQRIERQVAERSPLDAMGRQQVGFWLLWGVLVVVLFSA